MSVRSVRDILIGAQGVEKTSIESENCAEFL